MEDRPQTDNIIAPGRQTIGDTPDLLRQRLVGRFKVLLDWQQAMLVSALERVAPMLDAENLSAGAVLATVELNQF